MLKKHCKVFAIDIISARNITMYAPGQLLKIFQRLICYTVVCDVYVSQEEVIFEAKEALAFKYWTKESRDFLRKERRWCDFAESQKGKFTETAFNKCGNPLMVIAFGRKEC
jgi:hypothetical protein